MPKLSISVPQRVITLLDWYGELWSADKTKNHYAHTLQTALIRLDAQYKEKWKNLNNLFTDNEIDSIVYSATVIFTDINQIDDSLFDKFIVDSTIFAAKLKKLSVSELYSLAAWII